MKGSGQLLDGNRNVKIDDLWSVHSGCRGLSPIHDHGTKTIMGISCTTWTKVPPQIAQGHGRIKNMGCIMRLASLTGVCALTTGKARSGTKSG